MKFRNLALWLCPAAIGLLVGGAHAQSLSFQVAPLFPVGSAVAAIAVGDFNGDGRPDVVVTSYSGVSILLNDGNGGFQPAVTYSVGSNATSVTVGDFNGDGKADVAVTTSSAVWVLLGNGNGTFQSASGSPAGTSPASIAAADFNADGKLDLVVANYVCCGLNGGGVSVLLGNGNGTFQPATLVYAGSGAQAVAVGDFDGDHKLDIAVANSGTSTVAVLLGNGNGTFQAAVDYSAGAYYPATAIVVGDFNGDGKADLAISSNSATDIAVLLGYGNGTFQAAQHSPLDAALTGGTPYSLAAADWNGDGKVDLAVAGQNANHVCMLLGHGDGLFSASKSYAAGSGPNAVAAADFNGDGKLDLAIANDSYPGVGVSLLLGNGDGSFQAAPLYRAELRAEAIVTADFNGDGKLDLAEVASWNSHLAVLLGNGDGTFQPAAAYGTTGTASLAVGDFNGDGKPDLVTAGTGGLTVHLGNGDGTFHVIAYAVAGSTPKSVTVGDFNEDGRADLAVADGSSSNVFVLLGYGDGTFAPAVAYAAGSFANSVASADFDSDGKADLAVANQNGISVLLGNGDGSFQPLLNYAMNSTQSIAVADFNGDGKMDVGVTTYQGVSVLLGNGNGTFQAAVSYVAGNGAGTLSIRDLNGDGKPDLTFASSATVSLLLGNGTGTFQAPVNYSVPGGSSGANTLAIGDFDRDGKPDLAVPDWTSDTIAILRNTTNFSIPALAILKTHTGFFLKGQNGATYTLTVTNNSAAASSGQVTVTDTVPSGLTLVSMSGSGWNCAAPTCTRGDSLAAGATYPPITATVNVAANATSPKVNTANVSGGGAATAQVTDSTDIFASPLLFMNKTHSGTFARGQSGATYTVSVYNAFGSAPTSGMVTVTETMPAGLTLVSMAGSGWSCQAGGTTCTRSDPLAGNNSSYPAIIVTVNVAANAASPQINSVTVSGGGSPGAIATDSTIITAPPPSNDEIPGAMVIASVPATLTEDTTGATSNPSDPVPSCASSGKTVWFKYVATSPGTLVVDTFGSNYDTVLTAYPGTVSSGTQLACNDQSGGNQSKISFTVTTGQVYYVEVASYSSSAGGSLVLHVLNQGLRFVPMTPCRIADTRNAAGAFGGPVVSTGTSRDFTIPNSACGVPSTALAYSLNVAVVPTSTLGYLTLWPTGQTRPLASTLNSLDGRVKSNAAIVPAGTNGAVSVFASDTTNVILDINGYFVPAADPTGLAFYPITPCRITDTRTATAPLGGPSLAGGTSRTLPILSSTCNIPATAQAYSLNFAAVPGGHPLGYVTAWPTGQAKPGVSSLNAPTGTVVANAAIVKAGTTGSIDIFASDATNLVIDINGYFAPMGTGGLSLFGVAPCRVVDTRQPAGSPAITSLNVGVSASACGIPVSAQAHVMSVTVVPPASLGYLTLWAQGQARPVVSTLNALDASVTSNLAIVPAGNGSISVFASDLAHLIVDISGYFGQ